ncbi:NtaA/DmoA family FMN-dependent monooxygenase [Devosia sp. 2618]|uniref:NtaA/DmoA family FMN-dependent monooxygenase n=1 Tax=Devosia sp. 2618 TaxID=3156454 RepID=UPI003394AED1
MSAKRQIRLAAFIYSGQTAQAWRHPDITAHDQLEIEYFVDYAKTAEAGLFDTLFLADSTIVPKAPDHVLETLWSTSQFEPVTLMANLAAHTEHVGFIYTASVSDYDPSLLARQAASLDHLSHGRAGWNLVTSNGPATKRLGIAEDEEHGERYERAYEFYRATTALWDSFEDDAFIVDKERGVYLDVAKLHRPNIEGRWYKVTEPLRIGRPPQGYPVIAQAGSSETGRDFGAHVGDAIFCSNLSLEGAKAFYKDVKSRAVKHGREADDVKIITGTGVIWAQSQAEAEEKADLIASLHPIDVAVRNLGIDLTGYDLDEPFPVENRNAHGPGTGRAQVITDYAVGNGWTIRQTAQRLASTLTHRLIAGTTTHIADQIEEWFEAEAADGFVIMSPFLLNGFRDFITHVVPELQRRGLYRTEYEGKTLRENLGLKRPENQYVRSARAQAAE